jgi:hypothetical protein
MPSPSQSSRFPPSFLTAFETAAASGSLFIPSDKPHALKCTLWAFARALRKDGRPELADLIQVCPRQGGIELRHRGKSPAGLEVEAALSALPSSEESNALFSRLP